MKNGKNILKWLFFIAAAVYLFAVIKLTFAKSGMRVSTSEYRITLFNGIQEYKAGIKSFKSLMLNYAGNMLMFFPLGIFVPVFFKKIKFIEVVWLGFLLSALIELLQYSMSIGYTDIDDILTNTLGAALGAVTFFYIFNGRKHTKASYILSFVLIMLIELGSAYGVWRYAPNLLPDNMVVVNGMIAGKKLDKYDVRVRCYKMSPGHVFVIKDAAEDRDGNPIKKQGAYRISDTAVFVTVHDWDSYSIVGVEEMRDAFDDAISKTGETYVKLWLSKDEKCEMILLER